MTKPRLEPITPLLKPGLILGPKPPMDVQQALHDARIMGIRSIWCRGLWRFDSKAWAWKAVPT